MLTLLPQLEIFHRGYHTVVLDGHNAEQWQPRPEIAEEIERVWAKQPPADSWNSLKVRLEASHLEGDVLCLRTSITDYKKHLATRYQPRLEDRDMLLGVGAIIKTADGFYVFGQYNKDGTYNLISGGLDPTEDMIYGADGQKKLSFDHGLQREMNEEIGITADDITNIQHEMLCSAPNDGSPNLVYRVQLNITCAEIDKRIDSIVEKAHQQHETPEIIRGVYVLANKNAIQRALALEGKHYTPVAFGILEYLLRLHS